MSKEERIRGQRWVDEKIRATAHLGQLPLSQALEWYDDSIGEVSWIEVVTNAGRIRLRLTYEELEDCVKDAWVAQEVQRRISALWPHSSQSGQPRHHNVSPSTPVSNAGLSRVFLCHSSRDKASVRDLYRKLRLDAANPWLDEEDLLPGQDWELEIKKAVRLSSVVIVCLSRNSVTQDGYFHKEILLALDEAERKSEGTVFIVPARLEACEVPQRLGRLHWVDLFEERGYSRLLETLGHRHATRERERASAREEQKATIRGEMLIPLADQYERANPKIFVTINPGEDTDRELLREVIGELIAAGHLSRGFGSNMFQLTQLGYRERGNEIRRLRTNGY